jgi:hypothetical protein
VELVQFCCNFGIFRLLLLVIFSNRLAEEVLDKTLLVDIEDILILFVLFEQGVWSYLILLEHGLDLGSSLLEPDEIRVKLET